MKPARVFAPVGGFTQVNEAVNERLVERVVQLACETKSERFLDLYCGSGNFSLPLAAAGLCGVGVERAREPIEAASRAAKEQGYPVEFYAAASDEFLTRRPEAALNFDIVVVDPPRAGAKEILGPLVNLRSRWILMISCDLATFARDLRFLAEGGYRLVQVEGYDMFPQTHHVESLALLERTESSRLSPPAP